MPSSAGSDLKLKANITKRLHKELISYQREELTQRKRIDKMKADGVDEYDIKKQYEVLDETLQMIPDTKKRLENARKDLAAMISKQPSVESESEDLKFAKEVYEVCEENF